MKEVTPLDNDKFERIREIYVESFPEKIQQLRQCWAALNAEAKISLERAELVTEFYLSHEAKACSTPLKRAKAFEYLLNR